MFGELTKREKAKLRQSGVRVQIADNHRYKRKEIVLQVPAEPPDVRWVMWKMARAKGKLQRLALHERHKGAYWMLMHRNARGKGWHSQGVHGTLDRCVAYVVRHDVTNEECLGDLLLGTVYAEPGIAAGDEVPWLQSSPSNSTI